MRKYFWALQLTLISAFLMQSQVLASACNVPISKPIKFDRGAYCWSYKGRATDFYGNFGAGQRVSVKLTGFNGDYWEGLDPSVNDANNSFFASSEVPGQLDFVTPHAGRYVFGVYPCVFWGAVVQFTVCAS